ncbi:hypothetical protein [Pantoea vagans]|jgi:hypothetical protein|uniref:hypothetical protein n=1 Tax=Pantoea vagans TaxID=470934 RepID=UPI00366F2FF4
MNLTYEDSEVIAAYLCAERPGYKGPVFIDLCKLEDLHMRSAKSHVHYALLFASGKLFSGKRAAS